MINIDFSLRSKLTIQLGNSKRLEFSEQYTIQCADSALKTKSELKILSED